MELRISEPVKLLELKDFVDIVQCASLRLSDSCQMKQAFCDLVLFLKKSLDFNKHSIKKRAGINLPNCCTEE